MKGLQKKVVDFRDERNWKQYHNARNLATGITIEAAELLEHIRFKTDEEIREYLSDENNKKEFSHEMADILIFLLSLADAENIDLEKAFHEKMEINRKRYPAEKAKGTNKKYDEL